MNPKYNIGNIVKVFEYYHDEIVRDAYYGLIVDIVHHRLEMHGNPKDFYIYHILPNNENHHRRGVQTAEEFALEQMEGEC